MMSKKISNFVNPSPHLVVCKSEQWIYCLINNKIRKHVTNIRTFCHPFFKINIIIDRPHIFVLFLTQHLGKEASIVIIIDFIRKSSLVISKEKVFTVKTYEEMTLKD